MNKRLLIIDDNISVITTLAHLFEDFGYSVTIIDNGHRAIELARQSFYDVVIADINMPGINGVETIKAIKEVSPVTIAIMMTAGAPEHLIKQAMAEGAFGVIYKPFKMNEMIGMVGKAVEMSVLLIVDDQIDSMRALEYLLEDKGYKVVTADSGPKALDIVRHGQVDIALIDIKMPEMDGFTTARKIHEINPDTGIIMMTAHNDEFIRREIESSPFVFLCKPMDITKLIEAVETVRIERFKEGAKAAVLIIEDDTSIAKMVNITLYRKGYDTVAVEKGADALEAVRKKIFHAAIVDYRLPDMTGMEVIKEIKKISPHTKIIIMTAHAKLDIAIEAIKEHIFDFLTKPVDMDVLLMSLSRALARHAQ